MVAFSNKNYYRGWVYNKPQWWVKFNNIVLHKYNIKKPSIPMGYSTDMSETYDSMKIILDKVCYTDHMWRISRDLKVVAMLWGLQGGYTKNMCFLCLWDTRFKGNQYETHDWRARDPTEKGHNCVNDPLVPMENGLMPLSISNWES